MSAVRNWLEEIGLAQYADAFEANDIDTDLLTQIDDQVLKDIGVWSAGHRLRLRNAIAKLAPTSITEGISEVPASPPPSQAERRQLTVMFCDLVGSVRPRGITRGDPRLSEHCFRRRRALRRLCRQIYGRRGPDLFRLSAGA